MTNGVISNFDEENVDECFCLPVKPAIILLLRIILHVLVAIITTLRYVSHASAYAYFVLDNHPEESGKLSFGVLSSFLLM